MSFEFVSFIIYYVRIIVVTASKQPLWLRDINPFRGAAFGENADTATAASIRTRGGKRGNDRSAKSKEGKGWRPCLPSMTFYVTGLGVFAFSSVFASFSALSASLSASF